MTVDELPALAVWSLITLVVVAEMANAIQGVGEATLSGIVLGAFAGCLLAFGLRCVSRALWRKTAHPERVLVRGSGSGAAAMKRKIKLFPELHMRIVEDELSPVDRVILADERADPAEILPTIHYCRVNQVRLSVISPLRDQTSPQSLSMIAELPVLEYGTTDIARSTLLLKRGLDVAVGALMLGLSLPLLAVVALLIRLDSPGPILFRQQRVGLNGSRFTIYKLRTMTLGGERPRDVMTEPIDSLVLKDKDDPRVTRTGRFLRRLSLDEIPQLWNVLRGDMSLVGPRPEEPEMLKHYGAEHSFRLSVRPGMTGPMQVFGRGELTFSERLAVELDYVEHLTLSRDLRLLAQTPAAIVRGTGAY